MACDLTGGIARGCRDSVGGIVEVYLGNYPTGYTAQEWYNSTGGTIDGISGLSCYTFVPNKNSSNWVENVNSSLENSTIGYEQVLTLVFAKNQAATRNTIKLLGQANVVAIIRDRQEKFWMLGAQDGLELNGGNSQSGTALNDLNGWTITLTGMEPQPAEEVASALISTIVAD